MDSSALLNTATTVLVVGRDKPHREDVTRILKQSDCKAVLAGTGKEALDLAAAADWDGLYRAGSLPRKFDGWEAGTAMSFPCPDNRVKNLCNHAD